MLPGSLFLSAERIREENDVKTTIKYHEKLSRIFQIPDTITASEIHAGYQNGILKISVPLGVLSLSDRPSVKIPIRGLTTSIP